MGIQSRHGDWAGDVWSRDDSVLAGGGGVTVFSLFYCAVYGGVRGVDSGDGCQPVYCADRESGDVGGAAEFFAGVQSSWDDYRGADWDVLHLFRCREEECRGCSDEGGGYVSCVFTHGDYAGGADVFDVRNCCAALRVDSGTY